MASIHLRLQSLEQLYDSFDPAPFPDKALDRRVETYLLESAGEHGHFEPLEVVLHGTPALQARLADIADAIHAHFELVSRQAEQRHRRRRRVGRIALLAGLTTLGGVLTLRHWLAMTPVPFGEVLSEGLLILAWVALWRPIESIGFDSWESRIERGILRRLAQVPVRFQGLPAAASPGA
ncbi:hypothetical protein [Arenimonas caeni]|jgi:hypothetical protein|uniref:Uncharacterized protein n=1 Tax=Arenimonas caeni TaxID=2058085 RepID=A0A2P6M968_9GAMM|nr:hypothetical protein [Arenimonas caeni]MDY0022050.1 hypothetical protein [Arenimonas caeni]PRH82537.1 hypothetical protein C6N40_07045 [Arenimonas caeni]